MNTGVDNWRQTFYGCELGEVSDAPVPAKFICLTPMIIGNNCHEESIRIPLSEFFSLAHECNYRPVHASCIDTFNPDWARIPRQVEHVLLYAECPGAEQDVIEMYLARNDDTTSVPFSTTGTERSIELTPDVGIILMKVY